MEGASTVYQTVGNFGGINSPWAIGFITGGREGGYTLASVTALFQARQGSTPGDITVAIHAESGNNPADTALITLTGDNPSTAGEHKFTCSGSCSLSASTTYFLVMSAPNATGNNQHYSWTYTTSGNETAVPSNNGWSIENDSRVKFGANANWTTQSGVSMKFKVEAY